MLNEICDELNNYFIKEIYHGRFKIENGVINCNELVEGQYYRIVGSLFNDGIYKFHSSEDLLSDETFDGAVWSMAVPRAILDLDAEISAWVEKYGDMQNSPFSSESFGGYSYSKKSSGNGADASTWQGVFKKRLNRWRKI